MALECGFLSRKGNRREIFLLIMYFDRFMSREGLRNFYNAKNIGIPNTGRGTAFMFISLPKEKKRSLSPVFQQLRVRWTLFRKKMLKLRISAKSLFDGNTGRDQQVCVDKADLIDPILITRLRCWLRRTFTLSDGIVLFFSSVGFPSLHLKLWLGLWQMLNLEYSGLKGRLLKIFNWG